MIFFNWRYHLKICNLLYNHMWSFVIAWAVSSWYDFRTYPYFPNCYMKRSIVYSVNKCVCYWNIITHTIWTFSTFVCGSVAVAMPALSVGKCSVKELFWFYFSSCFPPIIAQFFHYSPTFALLDFSHSFPVFWPFFLHGKLYPLPQCWLCRCCVLGCRCICMFCMFVCTLHVGMMGLKFPLQFCVSQEETESKLKRKWRQCWNKK